MTDATLSLVVPEAGKLRDDIRRKVDAFFSLQKIQPPVSYDRLAALADMLIVQNSWDNSYKAFVMVCSGNAVWRSVVGSVPYTRRMLLLPQCLKDSQNCKGSYDELGLLCSECGSCGISGFLREAENLGYITIVTEGTTIATRLVEQGNVDAIIGVGCMEVLQKMFSAVRKYSVPAIGVPLLTCGCIDTTADASWIRDELNHYDRDSGFRLLNIINLREKTNSLFTETEISKLLGLNQSATDRMVREILLAGGKRIRPLLTVLAYESFASVSDSDVLKHLAMSVECFHKASLIHDDIEDNDDLRYGKETLHARFGIPVAINVGDLLIGEGYRLLSECMITSDAMKECLKVISRGHKAMSIGQGTELLARQSNNILSVFDILSIFHNKTSEAFRVSLLVGAVAGGADRQSIDILDQFSHLVGVAYQLKDDMEDYTEESESASFPHPSALTSMLNEKASGEDIRKLHEAIADRDMTIVRSLIDRYAIFDIVRKQIGNNLDRTYACLENLQNTRLKLALHEIVGKTFRDYV